MNTGYEAMPGQSIAWGSTSWDAAIQGWFDEAEHFPFGVSSKECNFLHHYTQVKYFIWLTVF